jgi:hypothetical protein
VEKCNITLESPPLEGWRKSRRIVVDEVKNATEHMPLLQAYRHFGVRGPVSPGCRYVSPSGSRTYLATLQMKFAASSLLPDSVYCATCG